MEPERATLRPTRCHTKHMRKAKLILVVLTALITATVGKNAEDSGGLPDAAAAWAQVEKLPGALRPRPEWKGPVPQPEELSAFQGQVRTGAVELAQKARAFAARFPTNEFAGEARHLATRALLQAIAAGDASSETELKRFVAATLADPSIPEGNRVLVLLASGNLP